MRKKWFTFPLIIIVFLASYFVSWFIDSRLYTRITAIWVMAVFTVVLAIATIWNIKITWGLLKQSKVSFLTDMIIRSLDLERELVSQEKATYFRYYENNPGKLFKDIAEAFGEVDKKFSKTYLRVMEKFQKVSKKQEAINEE